MLKSRNSLRSKGLSLALIAIFALSSMTVMMPNASAAGGPAPSTYNITWQKESPQQENNWTWTNIDWIYGPSITMNVSYVNGTSLIAPYGTLPSHYLFPGNQFYVNITVPKNLLELGRNVSYIYFSMSGSRSYYNETSQTWVSLWYANIGLQYYNQPVGEYGYKPANPWNFYSSFYNYTGQPTGGSPYTPPPQVAIFEPNMTGCSFVETTDYYSVRFQGELNCSTIPISGNFWCYGSATDTKGTSMNVRQSYQIVLIEPDPAYYGYGGEWLYCSSYVADMVGKRTDIAAVATPFKVVVDAQGDPTHFKNISVYLSPPVDWEFWYNTTRNPLSLQQSNSMTTNGWWWNYTVGEWRNEPHQIWGNRMIRLMWDSSEAVSIDEGYLYSYNYSAPDWNNYTKPFVPDCAGFSHFYTLDDGASDKALSDHKIAFVVTIPTAANASAGNYYGDFDGYSVGGSRINGWFASFDILGNNVVVMKLLKESSEEIALRITPGNYFRAAMEITATPYFRSIIAGHITNVTFQFSSPSVGNSWTSGSTDYWNSSYLQFYITLNTWDQNKTYVDVFNYSCGGWYNRLTYESGYSSSWVKLDDWWNYVQTSPQRNFTMSYDLTTNVLLVALNFTFKTGVPEGYYWWDGYLGNKTDGWYADLNYLGDEGLEYQKITVPVSASILVGTAPSYWWWWGTEQTWKVDPNTGALDLDGNNATTYDQFFVKHIYNSTSYWAQGGDRMIVSLNWGQYNLWSYFALMNYSWRYEWNEYYIWYYPSNMSIVPMSRFGALINSTVWDTEDNAVRPEYCQIGQYCINRTWDRIQAEYSVYPWWQPEYNWNWLEIGFNQNFYTPTQYGFQGNNLYFQYAGMLLFNDTNGDGVLNMGFSGGSAEAQELTHYFMFEDAEGIGLTTPFPGDSGSASVSVNDSVSWGVSVNKLNGTTYPAQVTGVGFAGCGYWWHDCYGTYITEGNFSNIPSKVGIANLNFTAHFSIPNANLTAGAVNEVKIKVDEGVGPWILYDHPQNQLSSNNYSMAIAFVATSASWQYMSFKTKGGSVVSADNDSLVSDYYNITSAGVKIANIQMGGANYTWGKDGQEYAMHSSTTPMSAFTAMYSSYSMSGSGSASICSFSVAGTNYFVTSSFKNWDGFSVRSDPYFAVYTVANTQGPFSPLLLILIGGVAIGLVVAVVVVRKRRGAKK
nr:hypothetical protein [Candidatus Njordarchaeota archaeon]